MSSAGWFNYSHQLFLFIHCCDIFVKSLIKGVMCFLGFIFVMVCIIVNTWGNVRYSEIRVKLEPARLKTKVWMVVEEVCRKAHVEMTVSSQLDPRTSHRLQISWRVPQVESADMIALYVTDPELNFTSPVFTLFPTTAVGWTHTPFSETYVDYSHIFTPVCLGFWVVYWRGHTNSCLQTNPSWMSDQRKNLGQLQLTDLFIPGSHDSAAYSVSFQPHEQTRYEKYVYTQEESVLHQLLHGVRYLDLRPGYHKNGGFYSHHGVAKLRHFQGVIDDIIVFLKNSKDILIMDLHHFPVGFNKDEVHQEFMKYLEQELTEYMVTPAISWRATLEDVWRTGKQLIVSYNNKVIVGKGTHKLWFPVIHQWGNVRTLEALKDYLQSVVKNRPLEPRAAMAELTPGKWDVFLDTKGGLRAMADHVNHNVTEWYRTDWGLHCNVVAVDFIRSSGLVNVAIDWNLKKAFHSCS